MHIGTREIGPAFPPYVIAEIGVNHDGSPARALELVRAGAAAGADAVKFQLFRTDLLMSRAAKLAAYQRAAGETDPVAMLARLELSVDALEPCVRLAHELGVHAIVTVFSVELVSKAESLGGAGVGGGGGAGGWDAYKTASPDIVNRPLLSALARTGRPLILSTGAADIDEVTRALRWLEPEREGIVLLQCVSSYPTPLAESAIGAMRALRAAHPGPIGYSDHTPETVTGAIAVAAGACVLEKHLTYDAAAAGPDHAASLEPDAMAEYVALARAAWEATRDGRKLVLERERDVRSVSRQSVVSKRRLAPGERIAGDDLTIKRPGTGIEPGRLREVIGSTVRREVEADSPLDAQDVSIIPASNTLPARSDRRLHIAVVTGSRAEFGLLRPVLRALRSHQDADTRLVVAGSHLVEPRTVDEVRAQFDVTAEVPMQVAGRTGRGADAVAVARGVAGFAEEFARTPTDWVLVLGDRIEAFAAATAASIAGIALAHVHGGDRAEGVADEAMRHAITKLAHLHLCATEQSAWRVRAMGEDPDRVRVVGSPAVDDLADAPELTDADAAALGDPHTLVLIHPSGLPADRERTMVERTLEGVAAISRRGVLMLAPNLDPGRDDILGLLRERTSDGWLLRDHLPRPVFVGLLKRLARLERGVLVGNSSAGLIEAAALGLRVLNVGPRQAGRERADNVTDVPESEAGAVAERFEASLRSGRPSGSHPYGDGRAGERIARVLVGNTPGLPALDPRDPALLRKRNAY